jgi:hypothetical protein
MAAENGLKLAWWKVIAICITISGSAYGALVTADNAIKVEIKELEHSQEKEHDKIDAKFEMVLEQMRVTNKEIMGQITKTNLELGKAVTLLEERTN